MDGTPYRKSVLDNALMICKHLKMGRHPNVEKKTFIDNEKIENAKIVKLLNKYIMLYKNNQMKTVFEKEYLVIIKLWFKDIYYQINECFSIK
jgi:hypothetical protein